jgi:hypothetical protein
MLVETDTLSAPSAEEVPGLVLVFSQRTALAVPVPLDEGPVELGRDHPLLSSLTDPHLSRRHFRVACDGGRFLVTDLGSRNGTVVDGAPLRPGPAREVARVVRAGDTLLLPVRDVGRVLTHGVEVAGDRVVGPAQKQALSAAQHAAGIGRTVQVIGEGGAGKEALARAYHAAGPAPAGPFLVVRCAALPEGELDLAVLGAATGGYVRAAHGGTLLLDGVARLSDVAQAKLLHLLARGELLPFGGAPPERIDVRVAVTARSELRADVEAGTLLEDLYYRLAAPRVTIPPLRDRPEEIPFLLEGEAARTVPGSSVEASLVEACLLRPWPGNVRELRAEARNAAQAASMLRRAPVGCRRRPLRSPPRRNRPPRPSCGSASSRRWPATGATRAAPPATSACTAPSSGAGSIASGWVRAPDKLLFVTLEEIGNLATIARRFGMEPAPVERCRVLELGSVEAASYDPGRESFDYILAHGVYSRVPDEVRDRLMAIFGRALAPHGVALVSYTALPGGYYRQAVREMIAYHTRGVGDPAKRAAEARAFAAFLAGATPAQLGPYKAMLVEQNRRISGGEDDHLLERDDAFYFHQVIEHAARHGLAYLADASLAEASDDALRAGDVVAYEQERDFVVGRAFRATLLVRSDVALVRR